MKIILTTIAMTCLISILIVGCVGKVSGPSREFVYPLQVGNYWEYDMSYKYVDPETGELSTHDLNINATAIVEITGTDILDDTLETFIFYSRDDTANVNEYNSATSYFNNRPDGLYQHDIDGTSIILPAKISTTDNQYIFNGRSYKSPGHLFDDIFPKPFSGSLGVEMRALAYPLMVGSEWSVYSIDDAIRPIMGIKKRIVNWGSKTVKAGKFDCFQIKWIWVFDPDRINMSNVSAYEYISEAGLIGREIRANGIILTDESSQVLDTVDMVQNFELKKYEMK